MSTGGYKKSESACILLHFFLLLRRELQINFPPRCLRILHHTNQITSDFQAYLDLVETELYHATQPDPRNVTENMLIALLAVNLETSDKVTGHP